jgi:hypothetical protein
MLEKFKNFLSFVRENRNTSDPKVINSKMTFESIVIELEKDDFLFKDTFFRNQPFFGNEMILKDDKPIWIMHYQGMLNQGYVKNEIITTEEIYNFLGTVTSCPPKSSFTLRGEDQEENDKFIYRVRFYRDIMNKDNINEEMSRKFLDTDLSHFRGVEHIYCKEFDINNQIHFSTKVYTCHFFGGFIDKKYFI